ncbi:pectate lyase, PelA/Pel-15E family [Salinimicrobium sediminis]|uniref:Pectate lyase, PelA/Pel-15E family n=1 Tax=Salinimicrobium sediminis TaxID=1343891 RepID=A0A285X1W8_9FLAO|nr:pectate lyase [Salinimicrobium sediminis]SOC79312.1 pectate lyase, PelA/Pel-15E family [Salinimicrobium sediminis]
MKNLILFFMILCSLKVGAQEKPTLFLIGDSTMSDKKDPDKNPEHGWGQMLPELMTSDINIENHAVNGRSTRSFIAEGRWEKVKEQLKPGDFVFIQFGHNDQKVNDPARYTNPFTQYRSNLEKFVRETREKGATPVLFSSIVRRNFNENEVLIDTHGQYPLVVRMVANDMNVPFIDMQLLTERLEIMYGPQDSKQLHLHLEPGEDPYEPRGVTDDTHLSKTGATIVATLALQETARQDLELKKYIKKAVIFQKILGEPSVGAVEYSEKIPWRKALRQDEQWYGSKEAQRIADNVLLYQHNNGGWYKNIDMSNELTPQEKEKLRKLSVEDAGTTIDNGATHTQLRYLAKVFKATGKEEYKKAFFKGIDFLLEAQYPNGGWPQFYPIKKGYYEHITYNDGAMVGVLRLLRDVAKNEEPYTFVDSERKRKARRAVNKGLEIILATQVKVDGKLTVWGAQHDKKTLEPAKARAYELASLSGKESAEIVRYLMEIENPSEEVKRSIRSAMQWFEDAKVMGKRVEWIKGPELPEGRDRIVVEDPEGGPLWGRFTEIGTNKIMFIGRDGVVKYNLDEIEHERRTNYSYIDNYAEDLIKEDYPKWQQKHTSQK